MRIISFLLAMIFLMNNQTASKTVELGKKFTLKKGEIAIVKGLSISLKLIGFTFSPCPKEVMCFWSGLAVHYELTIDGKVYKKTIVDTGSSYNAQPNADEAPYEVYVKESDYRTYAVFTINRPEARCLKTTHLVATCWGELADRLKEISYCDKAQDATIKDECKEYVAERLKNPTICTDILWPTHYCKYLNAVSKNDISQCASVKIFHWNARCFKEIAEKTGKGIAICDTLDSSQADFCREKINGDDY